MLNFVRDRNGNPATKLGRQYEEGHDGRHTVSPIENSVEGRGYGGDVVALPALQGGRIVRWGLEEGKGSEGGFYLDIMLKNGMAVRLKDFNDIGGQQPKTSWRGLAKGTTYLGSNKAIPVTVGEVLGSISYNYKNPQTGLTPNWSRLHVTVIKPGQYNNYVNAVLKNGPRLPYIIDPLGSDSPFNCPQYHDKIYGSFK